jgi:two-component system chemotaxis response regulator CheY
MNILLADDSDFMRAMLKNIVQKNFPDATLTEATTGQKVLEQFSQVHPDLILLDLIMPQKSGIDVLKEIGHQVKIIVISADSHGEAVDESKTLGAIDFVVKPYEADEVTEKIRKALTDS